MLQVAVPLARIALHELQDEVRRERVEVRPADARGALGDLLVEDDGGGVGLVEGRQAGEHLEDEHAEGVPVDGFVVARVADDLMKRGRDVRTIGELEKEEERTSGAR